MTVLIELFRDGAGADPGAGHENQVLYEGTTHPEQYASTDWSSVRILRGPGDIDAQAGGDDRVDRFTFGPGPRSLIPDGPIAAEGPDDIFVVNLLTFAGEDGRAGYGRYSKVSSRLMGERGGVVVLVAVGAPPLRDEMHWDLLLLVRYPNLAALHDLNTHPEWKQAEAEHRRDALRAASFVVTVPASRG